MKIVICVLSALVLSSCVNKELPEVKSPCAAIEGVKGIYLNPCIRRPVNNQLV
jgi:hypothetical protein